MCSYIWTCTSNPSPTAPRPPPSSCARATAREARSRSAPCCNLSDWPPSPYRGPARRPEGRCRHRPGPRGLHDHPLPAARPRRRRPRHRPQDRPRPPPRPRAGNRPPRPRACHDGRAHPRSRLKARRRPHALASHRRVSAWATELGLGEVDEDELYAALDWLAERQPAIETTLARRHLKNGTLVLYDVSSSYMEGRCCPLAKRGYSRDGSKGTLQIVYGLLCAPDGCPVAVEVFDGNTGDPGDAGDPGRQVETALWPRSRGAGRRSRHDHRGAHHRGSSRPPASTGSPRCVGRRSRSW